MSTIYAVSHTTMRRDDEGTHVTIDACLLDALLDYAKGGIIREYERRVQVIRDFNLTDDDERDERARADRWLERVADVRAKFDAAEQAYWGNSTTDEA